jgi:hypothetical protein
LTFYLGIDPRVRTVMAKNVAQWFTSVGGLLAVVAPKGLCPVCVAASGGLLASLGLGFLAVERNIRWMLAVTLTLGMIGLVLSARRHRRWWTVALGSLGAVVALTGRFVLVDAVLYGGMVLLTGALASDFWARKHPKVQLVQLRLRKDCTCERSKSSAQDAPAAMTR